MLKYIVSFTIVLGVTLSAHSLFAQRTIAVSGSSTVVVKPDFATFMVHVDRMIPIEQKWNAVGPDTFIDALVAVGVSPQDIEVLERLPADQAAQVAFDMMSEVPPAPEPIDEPPPPPQTGKKKKVIQNDSYEALDMSPPPPTTKLLRTSYRVKVRDLTVLPEALNVAQQTTHAMPEARYDVSDRNPMKMRALSEAVENARVKALILAEKMGGTLGEIISIDDAESGSFLSSLIDIAKMYTSGSFDGGVFNMPEIGTVKVTYSVK